MFSLLNDGSDPQLPVSPVITAVKQEERLQICTARQTYGARCAWSLKHKFGL